MPLLHHQVSGPTKYFQRRILHCSVRLTVVAFRLIASMPVVTRYIACRLRIVCPIYCSRKSNEGMDPRCLIFLYAVRRILYSTFLVCLMCTCMSTIDMCRSWAHHGSLGFGDTVRRRSCVLFARGLVISMPSFCSLVGQVFWMTILSNTHERDISSQNAPDRMSLSWLSGSHAFRRRFWRALETQDLSGVRGSSHPLLPTKECTPCAYVLWTAR